MPPIELILLLQNFKTFWMILANKVTTFINMYLIHIYNLYNRFYKGFNRYYITSTMKEWMGTLLMPTKHVCILRAWKLWLNITTPTEINGWRPTQLSSIFIASYLFSSKGNTYWRYQPFPTLSFNCGELDIKHVSFWNGVKS